SAPTRHSELDTFLSLLKEYKKHPELYQKITNSKLIFEDISLNQINLLPDKVKEARFKSFNADYRRNLNIKKNLSLELKKLQDRISATSLSDYTQRADLEVKFQALTDNFKQVNRIL